MSTTDNMEAELDWRLEKAEKRCHQCAHLIRFKPYRDLENNLYCSRYCRAAHNELKRLEAK